MKERESTSKNQAEEGGGEQNENYKKLITQKIVKAATDLGLKDAKMIDCLKGTVMERAIELNRELKVISKPTQGKKLKIESRL